MSIKTKFVLLGALTLLFSVLATSFISISIFNLNYYFFLYLGVLFFGLDLISIGLSFMIQKKYILNVKESFLIKNWLIFIILGSVISLFGIVLLLFYLF